MTRIRYYVHELKPPNYSRYASYLVLDRLNCHRPVWYRKRGRTWADVFESHGLAIELAERLNSNVRINHHNPHS